MKYRSFFGHLGLSFGLLGVIVMLFYVYEALTPGEVAFGVLLFPLAAWFLGLWFILGEYFEIKRLD